MSLVVSYFVLSLFSHEMSSVISEIELSQKYFCLREPQQAQYWYTENTLVSLGIKYIRQDQKQRINGEACFCSFLVYHASLNYFRCQKSAKQFINALLPGLSNT